MPQLLSGNLVNFIHSFQGFRQFIGVTNFNLQRSIHQNQACFLHCFSYKGARLSTGSLQGSAPEHRRLEIWKQMLMAHTQSVLKARTLA